MLDQASPYLLPDGKPVQIAFSGGRTSGYMLRQILDANGTLPERAVVTFQNTGKEMDETLDFVHEVGSRWDVPVVMLEYRPAASADVPFDDPEVAAVYAGIFGQRRLEYMAEWWRANATENRYAIVNHNSLSRSGEPFEALVFRRKYLPNQQSRFCSIEMKVRTAKRYLRTELGWDYWYNCVGLRADERHRLDKDPPKDRWTVWAPLAKAGVTKRHVQQFWNMQPFDLRLPNVKGKCWLGNCDGCFLKSEANVAALAREYPDRAAWWEGMEALATYLTNSSSAAFWSKRYSRRSMREFMEKQGDYIFNTEGALCQKDEGECAPL